MDQPEPHGSNNGTVTVSVNAHTGNNTRNGTVTISGSGLSETVSISQTAPSSPPPPPPAGGGNMGMGTNFWFLASWANAMPFKSNIPANPYSSGYNVWDQTFLNELSIYSCLRFMDWGVTNTYSKSSWGDRRLPNSPTNFDGTSIGTGGNDGLREGLAYEWMIDLCNRTGTDMWVCLPRAADDNYVTQLATLIKNNLNSGLDVYVEYSNEVWNGGTFPQTVAYTAAQGTAIGLTTPEDYFRSVQYAAYRSIEVWELFEAVWGNQSNRVINVLGGQSTNDWIMENRIWPVIFDSPTYNPNNRKPEALAIAPYFGGNGLNGGANNVFDLLRQDIYGPRPGGGDGRLTDVQQWHALAQSKGVPSLITYEGGQHIDSNPSGPNRDPEMYDVYLEYLNAIDDYLDLFCHYTHAGQTGNAFWGAKEFHGQSESVAHKYRALKNYANGTARVAASPSTTAIGAQNPLNLYPSPTTGNLHIEVEGAASLHVRVCTLTGKLLLQEQGEGAKLKLSLQHLPAGMYLIQVNEHTQRLIKQ
ncbi:MAG: T9SS type A sorting domain-containing protein [Bacteroidota bacterium]